MGLKVLQSNYTNPLPCVKQPNKLISKHLSVLNFKNKEEVFVNRWFPGL